MPISHAQFDELDQVNKDVAAGVAQRLLALLEKTEDAFTAEELTAGLLGLPERYVAVLAPEVADAAPLVQLVLDKLVVARKVQCRHVERPIVGTRPYYRLVAGG